MKNYFILILLLFLVGGWYLYTNYNIFELPDGVTMKLSDVGGEKDMPYKMTMEDGEDGEVTAMPSDMTREIFITEGVKHSIPIDEILSGGPPKDGIPSIDAPKFIKANDADFLNQEDIGLGLVHNEVSRFYPYQILVFHEIVNDTVGDDPVLVTYCPLCATGVVYERLVNGEAQEFGVSGLLWQSNLLMYNRAEEEDNESLWSQVLGESVLGPNTGEKLRIVRSDTVKYGDWVKKHPDTEILSRDTGTSRTYGRDPYGDYYTNDTVSFGATFRDTRLHPKAFVLGIEVDGKFKAYHKDTLSVGETKDSFNGNQIAINKSNIGEVEMFIGSDMEPLPFVGGFWFSWLAVHPETELLN